jgi:aminodeoxychorismate lyase
MSIFFNYNGKLFQESTPVISPDSRGLRYGDGLFETMKMANGKLLFAKDHFERLFQGMKILQFDIPVHVTPENIEKEICHLALKNNHTESARIRLTVLRGNGSVFDADNHHPNYIIQSWLLNDTIGKLNSNGLILGFYEETIKSVDILSNIKHNNYLPGILAALYAKQNKWNDAVIINNYNRVCETTIANIFLIKNKIIYTPALSEGCVAGIFRQNLLGLFKSIALPCIEKEITKEELLNADECFLTNSIGNVKWVKSIDNKEYDQVVTKEIYHSFCNSIQQM